MAESAKKTSKSLISRELFAELHSQQEVRQQYQDVANLQLRTQLRQRIYDQVESHHGIEAFTFLPEQNLLDLGCGAGFSTQKLLQQTPTSARVVAMDLSPNMVKESRRVCQVNGREILPVAADAHCLPFVSATFDVVFSQYVFYHLKLSQALPEILRVLKPQGLLITVTMGQSCLDRFMDFVKSLLPHCYRHVLPERIELPFSLENGQEILAPYFEVWQKDEQTYSYPFRQIEQFIAYCRTTIPYQLLHKKQPELALAMLSALDKAFQQYLQQHSEYLWQLDMATFIAMPGTSLP